MIVVNYIVMKYINKKKNKELIRSYFILIPLNCLIKTTIHDHLNSIYF
jgi:hypothetical protein